MDNFISGSNQKRKTDVSLDEMMQGIMRLFMLHDPLKAMMFEDTEFKDEEEKPPQGDKPPKKQGQAAKPVPMDIETLRQNMLRQKTAKGY